MTGGGEGLREEGRVELARLVCILSMDKFASLPVPWDAVPLELAGCTA